MPAAEIIAIGTELLLGEIQDTNTRYLARCLRDAGIDLYRTMVVGDNVERIALAIRESLQRAQILITTGGLGPTVDDPTRLAVALAVGKELEFRPELWDQIQLHFQRFNRQATENNRRQAFVPHGSIALDNKVGTAPAFIVEDELGIIISLPGVPREMEYLYENHVLPYLRQRFSLTGVIKARVFHTAGMGESHIDSLIDDLETHANPTVGLLAHAGQVDVRVTAKADSVDAADRMIALVAGQLRERLGSSIYGEDSDTLESVIAASLRSKELSLSVVECGFDGELMLRLRQGGIVPDAAIVLPKECNTEDVQQEMERISGQNPLVTILGANLQSGVDRQFLSLYLRKGTEEKQEKRSYGGPPTMSHLWAMNTALDYLRRAFI